MPVNHNYADPSFTRHEWYSGVYAFGPGAGWNGGPDDSTLAGVTPVPDGGWDPAEEFVHLVHEAVPVEQPPRVPPPRGESPADAGPADSAETLTNLTAGLRPARDASAGRRRARGRKARLTWSRTGSFVIVVCVAVIVAMVSFFGAMVAYRPLQNITPGTGGAADPSWPLLVYGPWTVASLCILRTALHRRRAVHSWFIVLLFSSVAVMLCMAQADRTFTGIAGAALPALASLACFQQLVRQITLTRPPRKGARRHRQRRPDPAGGSGPGAGGHGPEPVERTAGGPPGPGQVRAPAGGSWPGM
jgi:hypothetical protein